MRNLTYYFTNPFNSPTISLAELSSFTTDHLERMSANNPGGAFNARISATTSALGMLEAAFAQDIGQLGMRKTAKLVKDNFRKSLKEEIATFEAKIKAVLGARSPELATFFPLGRKIYSTAPDDGVKGHLDSLVARVNAEQARLGAALVAEVTAARDAWVSVYVASEASTGGKTATEAEKRAARAGLQLELFRTLSVLVGMHPDQSEQMGLYMRQQLLGGPATSASPGPVTGGGGEEGEGGGEGRGVEFKFVFFEQLDDDGVEFQLSHTAVVVEFVLVVGLARVVVEEVWQGWVTADFADVRGFFPSLIR